MRGEPLRTLLRRHPRARGNDSLVYGPPGVGEATVVAEVAHSIDVHLFGGLQAWLQASSDAVLRRQLIELFATHRNACAWWLERTTTPTPHQKCVRQQMVDMEVIGS